MHGGGSHVDRSIGSAGRFIKPICSARQSAWSGPRLQQQMPSEQRKLPFPPWLPMEVYGDLGGTDVVYRNRALRAVQPTLPLKRPATASSARGCRAWLADHSNQLLQQLPRSLPFPEKLIRFDDSERADGKPLPVCGDGVQIRDGCCRRPRLRLYQSCSRCCRQKPTISATMKSQ